MKSNSAITPEVDEILSRCADNAERIRVAKRLEDIAAEIWERVFGEKKTTSALPRFHRN